MDRYGSGYSTYAGPPSLDIPFLCHRRIEDQGALGEKVQHLTAQVHQIIPEPNESSISFGGLGLKAVHEVDSWLAAVTPMWQDLMDFVLTQRSFWNRSPMT